MTELSLGKIKERFEFYVNEYNRGSSTGINARLKGACIGILEALAGGPYHRHALFLALTGHESSKTMTEAHWYAIFKMVDPRKDEELGWIGRDGLKELVDVVMEDLTVEEIPLMSEPSGIPWDEIIKRNRQGAF
jgi:hypothetical protein